MQSSPLHTGPVNTTSYFVRNNAGPWRRHRIAGLPGLCVVPRLLSCLRHSLARAAYDGRISYARGGIAATASAHIVGAR